MSSLAYARGLTRERAQYLLENRHPGGAFRYGFRPAWMSATHSLDPDGLTEAEDRAVRKIWDQLPGWCSWFDALRLVARGMADADSPFPRLLETGATEIREAEQAYRAQKLT